MRITKVYRLALLGVAFLLVVGFLFSVTRFIPENRTYIIGWEEGPPDQVGTTSGEPTGFAVELVREAAKRRAIRLQWVLHPESSEAALITKAVDLWPMMVITEGRKQLFHLTDAYEEDEFGLFVDAKSAYTRADDLKQQRIAYDGTPFDAKLLREHFPKSTPLPKHLLTEAVKSVCDGEAQAFFEDQTSVFSLLLSNPPCPDTSLRMLLVPPVKVQLGIGATRESAAAADAIREEIGVMSSDGSLRRIAGAWSHNASQEVASLLMLQQAKSRLRWYKIGFIAVGGLLAFASWSAAGYRRQRMKSQAYCRALGRAERNVRLVADSVSEMVVAYDMQRSLVYANSGAEKLTGHGPAELQGVDPLSWIHLEDRPQVLALWAKAFDGQTVDQVVYRLITKDGSMKWGAGSWGPVVDETGHQVGVRATCLDITERMVAEQALQETTQKFRTIVEEIAERKQAEAALRASELQYRELFDNISACMFLLDVTPDGRFKFAGFNPAEEEAVGLSSDEVSGKFVEEVFAEDLSRKLTANYRRCLEAGAPIKYDDELNLPGGRRYFHSNLIPMRNLSGRIHRSVGVCIDVTDWKQAESAVRRSLDEIAHLNRVAAMGELTASLAHELNQPLAAILSNAQAANRFLNRESPNFAQVRECLTDIVVDDKRAGEVIKTVRALLRRGESQASLVDLNEVVRDAIRLLGTDAMLRHASVKFEPLPALRPVLGDRTQLHQVVLNLIVNGLDAVAERSAEDRWVLVRTAEAEGGGVELTVEDSGKGIAESDLARVFEPFYTTKQEGLGMGLSISRTILQAHGGRIWAERSAGHGAIFYCLLPVAQQGAAAATL